MPPDKEHRLAAVVCKGRNCHVGYAHGRAIAKRELDYGDLSLRNCIVSNLHHCSGLGAVEVHLDIKHTSNDGIV